MIKNLADIEKSLGLADGTLDKAIKSENEENITIPEFTKFTAEELQTRENTLKLDFEAKGREELLKKFKEDEGLDFEGRKDPSKFLEAYKNKITSELNIEPNKIIEGLKSDLTAVRTNLAKSEEDFAGFKKTVDSDKIQGQLTSLFSKGIIGETHVSHSAIMAESRSRGYSFEQQDGVNVVLKDGNVLKDDKTLAPIDISEFSLGFSNEFLKNPTGGKGGGDNTGGNSNTSWESFAKRMEAQDIKPNSVEWNEASKSAIKDKTLIM